MSASVLNTIDVWISQKNHELRLLKQQLKDLLEGEEE